MQPTLRSSLDSSQACARADKLALLMTQRARLFEHQRELLARVVELERQQQDLIARRTIHELQCHLYRQRQRNPDLTKQEGEAETTTRALDHLTGQKPPQLTDRDAIPETQEIEEIATTPPGVAINQHGAPDA